MPVEIFGYDPLGQVVTHFPADKKNPLMQAKQVDEFEQEVQVEGHFAQLEGYNLLLMS